MWRPSKKADVFEKNSILLSPYSTKPNSYPRMNALYNVSRRWIKGGVTTQKNQKFSNRIDQRKVFAFLIRSLEFSSDTRSSRLSLFLKNRFFRFSIFCFSILLLSDVVRYKSRFCFDVRRHWSSRFRRSRTWPRREFLKCFRYSFDLRHFAYLFYLDAHRLEVAFALFCQIEKATTS